MLDILYSAAYGDVRCFITWGYTSVIWVYHNVEAYQCNKGFIIMFGVLLCGMQCNIKCIEM